MDPAISICPAVAAPGRPRCSNTPLGVLVKSASTRAAAAAPRPAPPPPPTPSPPTSRAPPGSPHRLAAPHGGQAELATVRFPKPKPMTAGGTNRDLQGQA